MSIVGYANNFSLCPCIGTRFNHSFHPINSEDQGKLYDDTYMPMVSFLCKFEFVSKMKVGS
jgi:hypothetical protein